MRASPESFMNLPSVLLELAAAVVLLLFAISLLRKGVERSCGAAIQQIMAGSGGRFKAAFSGCGLAILFQSSTAVSVLTAGFAASGLVGLEVGLAILLGADLGSALVMKMLTFDLHLLAPGLLVLGGLLHLKATSTAVKSSGTAILGASLLLLSLKMVGVATAPLAQASTLPGLVAAVSDDPLTALLVAATFTWVLHSSIAAILLTLTFASQGILSIDAGIPMILGVNIGGAMIAVWLTRGLPAEARRLPIGNLIFRAIAVALVLPLFILGGSSQWLPGASDAARLVNLHLIFNLVLVAGGLLACGPMAHLLRLMIQTGVANTEKSRRKDSALDDSLISVPSLALAAAAREVLHMGDLVTTMLEPVTQLIETPTQQAIEALRIVEHEVNRAHHDIKLYITAIKRGVLSEDQAKLGTELTEAAIHLEYAGDVIAKSLLPLASKRLESGKNFSPQGWSELKALHAMVLSNVKLASSLLVSSDLSIAHKLVRQKEHVRKLAHASSEEHLKRLRHGIQASIETSNMHLEMARALKEINSLVTTMAYPRLMATGDLLDSRLARTA